MLFFGDDMPTIDVVRAGQEADLGRIDGDSKFEIYRKLDLRQKVSQFVHMCSDSFLRHRARHLCRSKLLARIAVRFKGNDMQWILDRADISNYCL